MLDILDGILIGGAGGAIAGLVVSLIKSGSSLVSEVRHKRRILRWMKYNTSDEDGKRYRSTRAIASWNNLTEDRVRYICSIHERIYMSTGKTEDIWSIYDSDRQALAKSMYSRPELWADGANE